MWKYARLPGLVSGLRWSGKSSIRNWHLNRDPKDEDAEGAACAKSLWQGGSRAFEAKKVCQQDRRVH